MGSLFSAKNDQLETLQSVLPYLNYIYTQIYRCLKKRDKRDIFLHLEIIMTNIR